MRKRIVIMIMGIALMALPIMAQQQEWKSTSAMHTSGSAYTPQVTAVGATEVAGNATTTESYSPAKGPSKAKKTNYDDLFDQGADTGQSTEFPIGDAVLPLMLCACAFLIYRASRRRAVKE